MALTQKTKTINIDTLATQDVINILVARTMTRLGQLYRQHQVELWSTLAIAEATYILVKQLF